ncbi:zinc ribbon domain-containing protein [Pantoea brenneri]|uniref:zinc ribbon domain-containing protein n=1 Tax=Pantoea brenneri TaxID=472694 RepID=UPI0039175204
MELLLICAVLGCIPAAIARSKGRSFGLWWIYGALLFIVALIHALCIGKDHKAIEQSQLKEGLVKCPYCAEPIKPEAVKCKHCGSDVSGIAESSSPVAEKVGDGTKVRVDRIFILIGVVVVVFIVIGMTGNS